MTDGPSIAHISFGDDLGSEMSPLHQIWPNEGQTLRVALLHEFCKPKASHYHWYRNAFYRCNTPKGSPEARCCKVQRSWTCVCLAMLYLNAAADGKLAKGVDIRYRIGYVGLARTAYRQVSECVKEAPGRDLWYSKADGHYCFRGVSVIPRWRLSPQAAQVEADARRWADGKKLEEKLGKKLTDAEWARLLKTGFPYEIEEG